MIFFNRKKVPLIKTEPVTLAMKLEAWCNLLLPAIRQWEWRVYDELKLEPPDNLEIMIKPMIDESGLEFVCTMQVNGHLTMIKAPWQKTNDLKLVERKEILNTFKPSLDKFQQRCIKKFKALKSK